MIDAFATHEVFNQTPPFEDVNLFTTDRRADGGGRPRRAAAHAAKRLAAFGAICGSAEALRARPARQRATRRG